MGNWSGKYKEEYPGQLFKHMQSGLSFAGFGGVVKVGESTLYNWRKDYPEFNAAAEAGQLAALNYYETLCQIGATGIDTKLTMSDGEKRKVRPNAAFATYILSRRFRNKYADKQIIEHTNDDSPKRLIIEYSNKDKNDDKGEQDE